MKGASPYARIYCAIFAAIAAAVLVVSCTKGFGRFPNPENNPVLSDIAALTAPDGADAAVFERLKGELAKQIERRLADGEKIVASAPSGNFGRVTDLAFDSGENKLTWSYVNTGDYDCNGEASIADITPVAINFGDLTDDGIGDDALETWIDGDKSGEVGVGDITPLALNFLATVASYDILTSDELEQNYTVIGNVAFPNTPFPVTFNVDLPAGALTYIRVQPIDPENNAGEWSNPLALSGNDPPTADLQANPSTGAPPLTVDFDASGSTDSDGSITAYDWDWDGDGAYEQTGGSSPLNEHVYTQNGSYNATVRVWDDLGASDTASVLIAVSDSGNQFPIADIQAAPESGKTPLTVDFDAGGSFDPDGSIVGYRWDFDGDSNWDEDTGGAPAASHEYTVAGVYEAAVEVTDDMGATDTDTVTVTVSDNSAPDASFTWSEGSNMFEIDFDPSGSSDPDGGIETYEWDWTSDGTYDLTETTPDVVTFNYGLPGTYDCTLRVTDGDGATDTDTQQVVVSEPEMIWNLIKPAGDGDFKWPAPALIGGLPSGHPAISYYDADAGEIRYIAATDDYGATWGAPQTASIDPVANNTFLIEANGNPAIAYLHETDFFLRCQRADDPDGTTWGSNLWIDDTYASGSYISMTDVAGFPGVAYTDNGSWARFSRALDADGDNWSAPVEFDLGSVNGYVSLCMAGGMPAIAYYDDVLGALKFVRAQAEDGTAWGLPVIVDNVGEIGSFGYISMAMLGTSPNVPAIAMSDYTTGRVLLYRATDTEGTTWEEPVVVDDVFAHFAISFANVDGVPCIAYQSYDTDVFQYHIYFRYAWDPSGSSWSSPIEIFSSPVFCLRLIDVKGRPAISFYSWSMPDYGLYYAYSPPG
ncbi:MAG: PKD domain-containing protein [bacterium]|jgi:PKD repeat protein